MDKRREIGDHIESNPSVKSSGKEERLLVGLPRRKREANPAAHLERKAVYKLPSHQSHSEWDDNKDVSLIYSRYLKRVTSEKLLEQMPRSEGEKFAGSKTCGSCHADAYKIWANSLHSSALKTLENDGHARDPDCVSCHVVGLDKDTGFMDRSSTPELTDVGCESCHGAGSAHSMKPESIDMIKIGANSCMSCHVKNHSPKFDYERYWQKIKH